MDVRAYIHISINKNRYGASGILGRFRTRDLRNCSKSSSIVKKSDLGRETSKELGSRRLRGHFEANLGPTLRPTWAQLGANLGLRRGCFPLWGENDEICAAPKREHDFRPPGGSKTGLDSGLNSIFESSSAEDAISKPFWRLLKRLPADLGPTWGRLGADLGPTWGPKGVREGVRRGSKIALGGLRGPRGHLEAIWAPFGGVLGVNVGSKIA